MNEIEMKAMESIMEFRNRECRALVGHLCDMRAVRAIVPVEMLGRYFAVTIEEVHASDCATHNGPAYKPGPCDCGMAERFGTLPTQPERKIAILIDACQRALDEIRAGWPKCSCPPGSACSRCEAEFVLSDALCINDSEGDAMIHEGFHETQLEADTDEIARLRKENEQLREATTGCGSGDGETDDQDAQEQ